MESPEGDGCAAALRLWPEEGPAGSSGANLAAEGPGGGGMIISLHLRSLQVYVPVWNCLFCIA